MLQVQNYLLENGPDALTEEFGIAVCKYPELGIMSLNYSQIESPKLHPIVRECRALIVTMDEPYDIVSRAYDRFYNFNECPRSNEFDISKYVGWEKLDGSIIPVYYHNGAWSPSTRKMVLADGTNTQGFCFRDLFFEAFDISKLDGVDKNLTLIFELVSPKNRIVKRYEETAAYLTGIRHKKTGEEFNDAQLIEFAKRLNINIASSYRFDSIDAIFNSLKQIDPFDEGYVFVNYETGHRLKIKNPSYMAIAHLRDNGIISPKRIALLVMAQDTDEYLNIFPEDTPFFQPYIDAYEKMRADITMCVDQFAHIEDQKEFALAIADIPAKSLLFQMRKGRSFEAVIDKLTEPSKLNLLSNYIIGTRIE